MTTASDLDVATNEGDWPLAASERRDLYHRVRAFPRPVSAWRRELVRDLIADPDRFPGVRPGMDEAGIRELVDEGVSFLREVARWLQLLHGQTESAPLTPNGWRVLDRLGPYRKLGAHRVARSADLPGYWGPLVPPSLRKLLAAGLESHASSICTSEAPACGTCPLRQLCDTWRTSQQLQAEKDTTSPTVIDLFCGAGGSSTGFASAGYRVLGSLDLDESALRTYWLNHPDVPDSHIIQGDVRAVPAELLASWTEGRRLDVLAGSPPCQGFSQIGERSKRSSPKHGYNIADDDRNHLYHPMLELARILRPRLVLLENVPGMHSARINDRSFLEQAAYMLESIGYKTDIWRLNAAIYGVPQDRSRVFLVASDLGCLPAFPEPEYHDASINLRAHFEELLPPITFDEATYDLPPREPDSGTVVERWRSGALPQDREFKRYHRRARLPGTTGWLFNHTARYQNADDLVIYEHLRPGEDSVHFVSRGDEHGRADAMKYRTDIFDDKYARLRGDRPSKTIVAHLARDGNGYVHPTQIRSITPREAARLQSFPDDYAFCGSPTDQWTQIGNAVPPLLARAIAKSFAALLERFTR